MQLSPPFSQHATRLLVTAFRTPPPYSSPKTINEVPRVRFDTRGAILVRVLVTRYAVAHKYVSVDYYFLIHVFVRFLHLVSLIPRCEILKSQETFMYVRVFRNWISF